MTDAILLAGFSCFFFLAKSRLSTYTSPNLSASEIELELSISLYRCLERLEPVGSQAV